MSGLCAFYCLDGRPVPIAAFEALLGSMSSHGPDGSGRWISSKIALGHQQMCTTPESEHESQPTFDGQTKCCLTFDGRVDNRAELIESLGLPPSLGSITDVMLVTKAYERWGVDCARYIIGDFAFALWDANKERLYCARDHAGTRPLFYSGMPRTFLVASAQRALLESEVVCTDINEAMVGEYLSARLSSLSETLYLHVRRLPPGHWLTVETDRFQVRRYWYPEEIAELRLTDDEFAERFHCLFLEAVRARARTNRPLAAELSGGLDSSSIVCMLSNLQRQGDLQQSFEAFSMTFGGLACDETLYARTVVERFGCVWNHVSCEPLPEFDYMQLARRDRDFPDYPSSLCAVPVLELARAKRMRVALRGVGGDDWLWGAPVLARCLDFAAAGQVSALIGELRHADARRLARMAARALARRVLRQLQLQGVEDWCKLHQLPPWLNRGFARRVGLVERFREHPLGEPGWTRCRRLRLERCIGAWSPHLLELGFRTATSATAEFRYPFLDRRLVEFMIALPEEQCKKADSHKALLRSALKGILPEPVRTRRTKAEFSHIFWRTLGSPRVRATFENLSVGGSGWVDPDSARAAHRLGIDQPQQSVWPLWMLYGIDSWFRVACAP